MTTLTGVWGNVVVRNNELVPFKMKIISLLLLVAGECPEGVL